MEVESSLPCSKQPAAGLYPEPDVPSKHYPTLFPYDPVAVATGYGLDDRGCRVRFPVGTRNFSLHHRVQTGFATHQPPIQWVPGSLFLGVKRPGSEAHHSPPSGAEVKNAWSYTSTPLYAFLAWCLVKHRDNFNFTYHSNIIFPSTFMSFEWSLPFWVSNQNTVCISYL